MDDNLAMSLDLLNVASDRGRAGAYRCLHLGPQRFAL